MADTIRYSALIVMLLPPEPPLVPLLVNAIYEVPTVNVSEDGPSTPMAPMRSSSAWAVVEVLPEDGDEPLPILLLDRSNVAVVASPENSAAV